MSSLLYHVTPQFPDFENCEILPLHLYLFLKNSSIKESIFEEVQTAFDLPTLKLIKTAITCWSYHVQGAKRVLDRYGALVGFLDEYYLRKHE